MLKTTNSKLKWMGKRSGEIVLLILFSIGIIFCFYEVIDIRSKVIDSILTILYLKVCT